MRATDINGGDRLKLKADNAYGLGPAVITVVGLKYRPGYKVPFVIADFLNEYGSPAAFRPSDFAGHATR